MFDVLPLFLVVMLVVPVLELGLTLPKLLFLLWRFIELVSSVVDQRKLSLIFLFILVL